MVLTAAVLAMALAVAAPADVTGRWQGTITAQREDGTSREDSALLILEQKGNEVTGTVGGNDADRHPITKGVIDGSKVTIQAKTVNGDRELLLELTLDGDAMKGTITTGQRKGQIVVKRGK